MQKHFEIGDFMAMLLKDELATKKDLELLEERILRYVDEKFHYLDKKIDRVFYLLVLFMVIC
jgi:hypothetical protein